MLWVTYLGQRLQALVVTNNPYLGDEVLSLEHLKSYDIPAARCSVESDRPVIEGLVAELLDGLDLTIRSFECISRPTSPSQRRAMICRVLPCHCRQKIGWQYALFLAA